MSKPAPDSLEGWVRETIKRDAYRDRRVLQGGERADVTFDSGVSGYAGGVQLFRRGPAVTMSGKITRSSDIPTALAALTLPGGFHPEFEQWAAAVGATSGLVWSANGVAISTTGEVLVNMLGIAAQRYAAFSVTWLRA